LEIGVIGNRQRLHQSGFIHPSNQLIQYIIISYLTKSLGNRGGEVEVCSGGQEGLFELLLGDYFLAGRVREGEELLEQVDVVLGR
jgi:hypothetical protein